MKLNLRQLKTFCLTLVFVLPAWLRAQSNALPANPRADEVLTLHVKDAALQNVLVSISSQAKLQLHYDKENLTNQQLVTLDADKAPVSTVLNELSDQTGLQFTLVHNNLIVSAKSSAKMQAGVRGVVKDSTGLALPGVSVVVKGTTTGTQTNVQGEYTLNAKAGDVLVFSFIGYNSQEVTVGEQRLINIILHENTRRLNEVVVTALGIRRESRSLTYGVQTVGGDELTKVPQASLVNSLQGKVAGAQITQSASGVGGSTKVVLRGNKSINGDNNALYVIDGIPMPRNESGQLPNVFGGQDRGDAIENLNPDDVESITVLPGSSSAALYGSQGANGVILITTKKGIAGKTNINFSSNTTFDSPFVLPKLQTTYGQTTRDPSTGAPVTNSQESWGDKTTASSFDPKSFFNTGKTFINALSVQTGTQTNQSYFSFESTNAVGVIPNNKLDKYNFTARNSSQFFNNKLTLDVSANYINQTVNNRPFQGFYYNPLVPVLTFPRGIDMTPYKNNYEVFDPVRNLYAQNWPYSSNDIATQNPYWIVNRNNNQDRLSRILGTVNLKYTITDWLNIQGRVKIDRTDDTYEAERYATSSGTLVGPKGSYQFNPTGSRQTYADFIANFNKALSKKFTLTANLGTSIQDYRSFGANTDGNLLRYTNVFTIANIDYTRTFPTQYDDRRQIQAIFGTATLGYDQKIFLDVTGRNDWDSSLAFTNNVGFFYPAIGLNAVLSQLFKLPEPISFAKLRANLSNVGNGTGIPYASNPGFTLTNSYVNAIGTRALLTLKPERTRSYEIGLDARFFNDNLTLSISAYKSFSRNQIYTVQVSPTTGYSNYYYNGGNLMNKGIEGVIGYNQKFGALTWKPSVNFSINRNRILDVLNSVDPVTGLPVILNSVNLSSDVFDLRVQKGGSFGDMYAAVTPRDANGNVQVDGVTGAPIKSGVQASDYQRIGNYNPRFLAGFQNEFNYKNFRLSFLVDGRFGGQVVSLTQAVLDQYGVSEASGKARDNGGVVVNGKTVSAIDYYKAIGSRNPNVPYYVYSATNIRLREVVFGYTLPGTFLNNKIKNVSLSAIGRNLWMIKNNAPFDPDVALSTQNGFQGLDAFNLPSLRSFGFKVSAQF
jgi:TonB-linked SusC/RagA family outer membrane protein